MRKTLLSLCCLATLGACSQHTTTGEAQLIEVPSIQLQNAKAHWLSPTQLVWQTDPKSGNSYRLYAFEKGGLNALRTTDLKQADYVDLQPAAGKTIATPPHLADFTAFNLKLTKRQAKAWAKTQLVAVSLDDNQQILSATQVQFPLLLDNLYTSKDNDADETTLGVVYDQGKISTKVWAPTALEVSLVVFDNNKQQQSIHAMQLDDATGIWFYTGNQAELDRKFYRYQFKVFHPATKQIETYQATDPYSYSLSANAKHSQFVNLDDADLKPDGWDGHAVPVVQQLEDAIIYEAHIRDFSILDESTSANNRGKYLAFTEQGSAPMQHLQELQKAGLTHFHILPANDIASINEKEEQRIDLTSTVAELCAANAKAPVCGTADSSKTLLEVISQYKPETGDAQALMGSFRGMDGFNWGYDPQHFAAPDGSYATDPDGVARIIEMRAMNQSLHEIGLRVVLDVVYNHTSNKGLHEKSVLDKVVPGYYQRLNEVTGAIERSTCCENTATEHRMMDKLMSDSLVLFAKQYGFDSFRFDLMGHIPKQSILNAREAVKVVDPDTYFYGEGWNFGEVANNRRIQQASQLNMAGTEVGTFSDRQRDAVRFANLFKKDGGLTDQDSIRVGLAGNISSYQFTNAAGQTLSMYQHQWNGQPAGYSDDPADTINYVSKHDNETLWDMLQYNLPTDMPLSERVRVQNMSLSVPLLSQGIPFLHMGSDLIRSKSMDRNTYDAGDWFNRVDFTKTAVNWNQGLPLAQENKNKWDLISPISANPHSAFSADDVRFSAAVFKEFLKIRSSSKLFRLNSAAQINQRLAFHNTGKDQIQGVIVMSLVDGQGAQDLDPSVQSIVVVFNGRAQSIDFAFDATGYQLHSTQANSVDAVVRTAKATVDSFKVPGRTTAVFVKPQ